MYKTVQQVSTVTVATDALEATAVRTGGKETWVEIPTFAAGVITATGQIYCQVSETSTTSTFRRVWAEDGNKGLGEWVTTSSTGNYFVKLPNQGFKWTILEYSNTATAANSPVFYVFNE